MAGDGIGHREKCERYGWVFSDLPRLGMEAWFWGLFAIVIVFLVGAGQAWALSEKLALKLKIAELDVERGWFRSDLAEQNRDLVKRQKITVAVTSICAVFSIVCAVFEAIATLALEYCDGEDLVQFYWVFWGLIQVGGCIALTGLAVYHIYSFNDKDHPPWMIGLGTPVLVISGLGHLLILCITSLSRKWKGIPPEEEEEHKKRSYDAEIKQLRTNNHGAYIISFTPDKEPLIQFACKDRPSPPPGARMIDLDPHTGIAIFKYPATTVIRQHSRTLHTSAKDSRVDGTDKSVEKQKQ